MTEYFTIEEMIEIAKKSGVSFGRTDPYNRLRYYTKIGWLPHMVRKQGKETKEVVGHYPAWALTTLIKIEQMKKQNFSNEKIAKTLISDTKIRNIKTTILNKNNIRGLSLYAIVFGIAIVIFLQINIRQDNQKILNGYMSDSTVKLANSSILDTGVFVVVEGNTEAVVITSTTLDNVNVSITFSSTIGQENHYWVEVQEDKKTFKVHLLKPVTENKEFTWAIIDSHPQLLK